jgi:hypothetical protein
VKGTYQSVNNLLESYKGSKAFIVTQVLTEQYTYNDNNRLENRDNASLKSLTKIVSEALEKLQSGDYTEFQIQQELANLQLDFPTVMAPINKIGIEEAKRLKYDLHKIKYQLKAQEKAKDSFGLMTYVKENFTADCKYTSAQIEGILSTGIKQLNLTGLTSGIRLLREFCEIPSERSYIGRDGNGRDIRVYLIKRFWDNVR